MAQKRQPPTCKNCGNVVAGNVMKCPQCGQIQSSPTVIIGTLLVLIPVAVFAYVVIAASVT